MADLAATLGLARSLVIYYGQPWRRRALRRFYAGIVRPGDLVFDIGAHVGSRSRTLAALGAQVVAVEPQPRCAEVIARTLEGPRVRLVRKAVGRAPGEITLHVSRRHPTVTTTRGEWIAEVGATEGFRGVRWDQEITVPMTTLDALIAAHGRPGFCKIDVEGAEAEILAGLSQPLPWIAFEVLPAARGVARACVDRLEELGRYRFNLVRGESHRFDAGDWVDAGTMRRQIAALTEADGSGDVYARLDPQR
ncbi:FkbM family methyltransferase [Frigidibacter sp. MR17.24]|uniref:FkbM family methyltransferase n=1 Tax=Frigidibacter sp. MR17.24 TaxID=3127345 RepID=UPI003012E556